ncbi:hypothetical protein EGI22_09165 [Lacihabitans sp. LS3-19]|uniref:DUF6671 family protein n=1 Tax=Lacihabitans sp. LS3-19 TaxID=2487335 RepID=UPI0020CE151E|nr:DUF6671 family protein [Lacihabitans sp. LS3-19]MCP9768082.1 hypothetical protein [Lacihabitans sp. LS3-19]
MFEGRTLFIATKHQKEKVISPILEKELGVKCIVHPSFDSDIFGTFSGEIEREEDPLTTARKKCQSAMETYNCDLAVASEGSFGSHPSAFFIPADDEILIFIDKKNGLEIKIREISTDTNFGGLEVSTEKELLEFANSVGFPSHGLILKKADNDLSEIKKGITNSHTLLEAFNQFMSKSKSVWVETDMRAMHNPKRMKVIEKATLKLVDRIKTLCPVCQSPGFGINEVKKGLPCQLCGLPTSTTLSYVYTCQKCNHKKEELYPNQKTSEDPRYCDFCNP